MVSSGSCSRLIVYTDIPPCGRLGANGNWTLTPLSVTARLVMRSPRWIRALQIKALVKPNATGRPFMEVTVEQRWWAAFVLVVAAWWVSGVANAEASVMNGT